MLLEQKLWMEKLMAAEYHVCLPSSSNPNMEVHKRGQKWSKKKIKWCHKCFIIFQRSQTSRLTLKTCKEAENYFACGSSHYVLLSQLGLLYAYKLFTLILLYIRKTLTLFVRRFWAFLQLPWFLRYWVFLRMGQTRPLFHLFLSFRPEILGVSRIRTWIVGVEGKNADH